MITAVTDCRPCVALRRAVFIEEQGIDEADEIDDYDDQAIHLLATVDDQPAGTARLLTVGETGKIGRICVLAAYRGRGLGKDLVKAGIAHFAQQPGITSVMLGAQDHAIGFYESLGFVAYGPFYDDAGIPHRDMARPLNTS